MFLNLLTTRDLNEDIQGWRKETFTFEDIRFSHDMRVSKYDLHICCLVGMVQAGRHLAFWSTSALKVFILSGAKGFPE